MMRGGCGASLTYDSKVPQKSHLQLSISTPETFDVQFYYVRLVVQYLVILARTWPFHQWGESRLPHLKSNSELSRCRMQVCSRWCWGVDRWRLQVCRWVSWLTQHIYHIRHCPTNGNDPTFFYHHLQWQRKGGIDAWSFRIGHVNIRIIIKCIGNSQWCLYNTQSKSNWLFNTQSIVQHADWLIFIYLLTYITNNMRRLHWTLTCPTQLNSKIVHHLLRKYLIWLNRDYSLQLLTVSMILISLRAPTIVCGA